MLIGTYWSCLGALVVGADVFRSGEDLGPPDPPGAESGREDAGVCGATAGEGLAPLPFPGALIFTRLKI